MQFRQRDQEAIARGEITLTFRRWRSPQARVGGQYRIGDGVLEVTAVDLVDAHQISDMEARAAGFDSPAGVLKAIRANQRRDADPDAPLYRVGFRYLGERSDPRAELAADDRIDVSELDVLIVRLAKMDARSRHGAWTGAALEAIAEAPGRRAAELAAAQGRETAPFKADIRKLKALGLTISLEVGYELSPRGRVVLEALRERTPSQ